MHSSRPHTQFKQGTVRERKEAARRRVERFPPLGNRVSTPRSGVVKCSVAKQRTHVSIFTPTFLTHQTLFIVTRSTGRLAYLCLCIARRLYYCLTTTLRGRVKPSPQYLQFYFQPHQKVRSIYNQLLRRRSIHHLRQSCGPGRI